MLTWPELTEVGEQMAGFLMGLSAPRRIVLISHHSCVRYQTSFPSEALAPGFSVQEQQCLDLKAASARLRATYPAAEVTAFYAAAGENGMIVFEPV